MRALYRDINLPTDDSTLPDLEGLTKEDIIEAFRLVTSHQGITRSINRLHNRRKERQSKEIKAWQLVSSGFEAMAEIQIMVDDFDIVSGRITNARAVANGDNVVITILGGRHIETTWSVHRDAVVRVWPKEVRGMSGTMVQPGPNYDKPADHGFLRASYIAENLSTFFGKRMSVKNVGTGELQRVETRASDPDYFYFDLGLVRNVKVHKDALIEVYKTLGPEFSLPLSEYTNVRARAILATPRHYLGRRVVFDDDRVDGILQEVQRKINTAGVVFKVDDELTQLTWNEMVKVYPREQPGLVRQGRYPWATNPTLVPPPPGRNQADDLANQARAAYGRYLGRLGLVVPDDRPDYTVNAYSLAVQDKIDYRGMTAELKPGLKGKLTQAQLDNEGKVLFVIDGIIYKRNRNHIVRLWKKENN